MNTYKAVLVFIVAFALSVFLLFLSSAIHNKFIVLTLLGICTFLTPVIFVPLFYSKVIHKSWSVVFTLVYVIYLMELFSRILIPQKSAFDRSLLNLARKPYPFIEFKGDAAYNKTISYPVREEMKPKAPSEYRIFIFGGSTVTIGKPTIPGILQQKFSDAGYSNVHVYNMGVISSNANMELARVIYEAADYSPDLIVFYDGGNDIMMPYGCDPRPGYPFNFFAFERNIFYDIDDYPMLAIVAYKSNLLRMVFRDYYTNLFGKQDELRKQADYGSAKWEKEIARQYVSALSKTDKFANTFGAKFIAFLQPTVYYKNKCTANENKWKWNRKEEYDFNWRVREDILRQVDSSTISNFSDLTKTFENDSTEYYDDWIHTNQAGIEIVANRIYDEISRLINVPRQ